MQQQRPIDAPTSLGDVINDVTEPRRPIAGPVGQRGVVETNLTPSVCDSSYRPCDPFVPVGVGILPTIGADFQK